MYIKYCEEKYNIGKGCNSISIGTLESYIKDDSNSSTELIYDNNEISKSVHSDAGVELDNSELYRATGIKFGANRDKECYLDISDSGNGLISSLTLNAPSMKSSFTHQSAKIPNCFIYCLANTDKPCAKDGKKINNDYDSFFEIENIYDFCHTVSTLLRNKLTLEDFDCDISKDTLSYFQNIRIHVICKNIEYKESKTARITKSNKDKILNEIDKYERWIFVKDKEYESVPEFRIAFVMIDEYGRILPVKKESKLLYLPEILGIKNNSG